jgi:hypothetical protein
MESEFAMQLILFTGRVLPAIHTLSMPTYSLSMSDSNFASDVSVEIQQSTVTVSISVETFSNEMLGELTRRATRIAKAAIDLVSFATGKGLHLVLDRAKLPDGREGAINLEAPVVGLCTAYTLEDITQIMPILLTEQDLWMAFGDLTETMTQPDRVQINCGRAIETIRTLVDPNPDRTRAWQTLRERLNISESYLRLITDQSVPHRHGHYRIVDDVTGDATRTRSWIVMNRFLEYRKRGNHPLPISDFPTL